MAVTIPNKPTAFELAQAANRAAQQRPAARRTDIPPAMAAEVFGDDGAALFAPGTPQVPDSPQPVRYVDFGSNTNRNTTPRAGEAFGFPQLRAFANIEMVRLAIETRKEQVEALDWHVRIKDPKKGEKGVTADSVAVEKFLLRPDGSNNFSTWVRMLLEEMLVLDAPCIERQRLRNGKLGGLLIVPGDTIHPLLDDTGRRPTGPGVPAYQQIIKGNVWCLLDDNDLIYQPRNPRPGKIYGYGPVEQIIVTVQTIFARQVGQLGYFTDGNIPAGILTGPEGWTPAQLQEMQDGFDILMKGNPNHKSNLIWTPFGTKYQSFKEAPLKNDFDEWLARIVMYAFNLPPTPFIKQMNRSTASSDSERGAEEGLMPIKLWLKRLLDAVIQNDLGHPDLEFVWADRTEVNADQQAKVDDYYLRNGSTTINEVRDQRGLTPIPGGDIPLIYSPSGVLPLSVLLAAPAAPAPGSQGARQPAGGEQSTAPKPAAAKAPAGAAGPKQSKTEKLTKSAQALPVVSTDRPKARRHQAEIANAAHDALRRAGATASAELERRLRALHKAAGDVEGDNPLGEEDAPTAEQQTRNKAQGLADLMNLGALSALAIDLTAPFADLYADAGQLTIDASGVDGAADLSAQAQDAARVRAASLIDPDEPTGIVRSTRNMVAGVIAAGLLAGLSASQIADNVQSSYAFSPERADDIGETETQRLNGAGILAGAQAAADAGASLVKGWDTSGDDKVEEVCLANEDAGLIPLDEPFPSGDQATPAHPRCRCDVTIYVASPDQA